MNHKQTIIQNDISEKCNDCTLCLKECAFLAKYGTPKYIAETYDPRDRLQQSLSFECSLCGLCAAICPEDLSPQEMFLEWRREAVEGGWGDFQEHAPLLAYERRGASKRYSWYGLPRGCDTIFFPGCTLPGIRPQRVLQLYERLKEQIPNLGIVLDCCAKPSHDLGRQEYFEAVFQEMRSYLLEHGIQTVLTACPNCHKIFKNYGDTLRVKTIYEVLAENGRSNIQKKTAVVTIHDPCAVRFEYSVHQAVRNLLAGEGFEIEEMPHRQENTLCCGEGGAVSALSPNMARSWAEKRKEEAHGKPVITYCAGCANYLGRITPAYHLLDLIFEPEATLAGKAGVSRAPVTYWNRIRLKSRLKKILQPLISRERTFQLPVKAIKKNLWPRLLILVLIMGGIAAIRLTGAIRFLDQETLRNSIQSIGLWAPALYMLLNTLAPVLFLPGIPITLVGGILFGPFWGVIYTIFSATAGACLAFLVARYVGRDWVSGKLKNPRWRKLDDGVERQGWKVVAFTRLIPLFPYNLLNYAFGLTKIGFIPYALTSFICMLPACIAYVVFSSSLLDIIKGKFSPAFIIGIGLIIIVLLAPAFYRNCKQKKLPDLL